MEITSSGRNGGNIMYTMDEFIAHHGILGQRWGIRRYQNKDGSLTAAGRRHWDKLDRKTKAKIKDNMIRSSNVKVLQAHQKYLTPNELRKATERLAANKKVSEFKEEQIRRGMQKIVELGTQAKQVGDAVSNLTESYNKIAKVINGVAGKNLPIIGEAKAARKFSFNDIKNLDEEAFKNLKGEDLANASKAAEAYNKVNKIWEQGQKEKARFKEDKKAAKEEKKAAKEEKEAVKEDKKAAKEEKEAAKEEKKAAKAEPTKFTTVDPGEYKKPAFSEKTEFSNKTIFSENKPTKFTVVDPGEYKKTSFYQENASKSISAFKEHYTSDDISSARNYVMSNFGNVSYNSIGNYKYSNPSFSAQYNKMTERNNNRNPYYVSHADMSYDALIASFAN